MHGQERYYFWASETSTVRYVPWMRSQANPGNTPVTDIIVEAIFPSEEIYVRYMSYIGDGDSTVEKAIRERLPYGRHVKKIDCANHLLKNFSSKLCKAAQANKEHGKFLTNAKIQAMQTGACAAVKYRNKNKHTAKDLENDFINVNKASFW